MTILKAILLVVFFILTPAIVLWLCRKIKWLAKIGPILILYFIGAIVANIGVLPKADITLTIQDLLSNAMIPLAIPLMLFSFTFKKSETRDQVITMITGLFAVVIAVFLGYAIFGKFIPNGPKVAGMYTACLTGGTVNMAAVSSMLEVDGQEYALLNTYDMIVSFTYLVFVMAIGIKWARKLLPVKTLDLKSYDEKAVKEEIAKNAANPYKVLLTKKGFKDALILLGVTLLIVGISAGIAVVLSAILPGTFMMFFILAITSVSIAASFIKPLHNLESGYDIGMYFIYIFSLVVASMADVRTLDFSGAFYVIGFLFFMEIVSLAIQLLTAKLFKVDADTAVITSVTYINSPPFVPMIAAAMRNSRVLMPGLSIGIIGYAVGNYLGVLVFGLLS